MRSPCSLAVGGAISGAELSSGQRPRPALPVGRGGRRRTQTHGVHMALAMGPRKKNVHDPGFAKKRDEAQVVEERSHRVGAAARKAGVGAVKAKNKRQAVFIFLDEPESSVSARLFSLLVVVAIIASSVSFVAETVPYVRLRPDLLLSRVQRQP